MYGANTKVDSVKHIRMYARACVRMHTYTCLSRDYEIFCLNWRHQVFQEVVLVFFLICKKNKNAIIPLLKFKIVKILYICYNCSHKQFLHYCCCLSLPLQKKNVNARITCTYMGSELIHQLLIHVFFYKNHVFQVEAGRS